MSISVSAGRSVEEEKRKKEDQGTVITEEALREAEKYIEEEEGPSRRLTGKMALFITAVAVIMSLVHLYAAIGGVMTQVLRGIHVLFVLFLEATPRTTGWIMPAIVIAFLTYAFIGPELPSPWTHRGYDVDRVVGHMYMTLEGIFGVPIDF